MLLITGFLTICALIVLIRNPRLYAKWDIEPWLFKWVLGMVVVAYLVAFLLTIPSILDSGDDT
jgi:hypothetical protein